MAPAGGRRRLPLAWHLAILVACATIPILVFSIVLVVRISTQERADMERRILDVSRALAAALDREILVTVGMLELLAQSSSLTSGDLPAFHAEARRVVASRPSWLTVLLLKPDGQQLLNSARPWGFPLGRVNDPESLAEVVRTRKPTVGNLVTGPIERQLAFPVRIPIVRDGAVVSVLTAVVRPGSLQDLLVTAIPHRGEWTRAFGDRNGTIVARSREPERFVGAAGTPEFVRRIRSVSEDFFRNTTIDGAEVYVAFSRAPFSRWTAGVAYPVGLVDGPLRRSLALTIAAGLTVAMVTALAAYVVGRRIARPIRVATVAAQALTRGERVPVAASTVREVAQLGDALERSGDLLRRREVERDHLLVETETARREAEAASRAKDDFLAMLGHELRNPLGAIASAVGVLDLAPAPPDTAARAHTVIRRQVEHLSRLVDDLLDVTRVTTGRVTLDRAPVDLGELVTQLVAVWRVSGRFDRHTVALQASPVWVVADATRLEQVVSNILDNALKYTPAGGRVGIRVDDRGDTATIEVADTGVGIAPALIEKMFEPFVQGERALDRAQGGLGIGLTLVRTLVGMHGGRVEAHSDGAGRGAVFTISLPRITPPAGGTRRTPAATVEGRPRRVLVVEDHDDARDMVRTALTIAGHEVHEAADGRVAVAMAATVMPDIAIVDIGLPGLDGYDVARAIRGGHGGRSVVLIAMTGYGQEEDRRRALEAGFDAHLTKPVDPDRLLELVAGGARQDSIRS